MEIPDIDTSAADAKAAETVTNIEVETPSLDDNRSFMDTFIEEAGSQMEDGDSKQQPNKVEPDDAEILPIKDDAAPKEDAPEKPTEEKKPDAKDDDTATPKGMSKEASRVFRELKAELKDARTNLGTFDQEKETLTNRIKELESTTGDAEKLRADLKERDERLSEQKQAIELIRLESSDLWKQEVAQPLQAMIAQATELAKEYEIPEADVLSAVTSNDKRKLDEILSDLPEYDRFEAHALRKKYAEIVAHRDDLQKSGTERLAKVREEDERRYNSEREEQQRERTQQIATTLPAVEKNISRFLETDEDKERMGRAMEIAKSDSLHTYPAHVQAGAVLAVAALPIMSRRMDAQTAEITQLKADLAGFRNSDPGAGGGGQKKEAENSSGYDEGDTFESALLKSVAAGR